ncbi:cupin domain-containing protein [Rhodococcus qingshengii]|uniref:cupin domain-containing protein n=1 Tax=Rhodococcus qingshengii TaxID=334542 RepID=UPI0036D88C8B
MTITFRPQDLDSAQMEESLLAPPSASPLSGDIVTRSQIFFRNDDGLLSGTWESEVGTARWEFVDRGEIIHVLSGRMIATVDDGEPVEITAGTTAYFPLGWRGTWDVQERLRKVFVVYPR